MILERNSSAVEGGEFAFRLRPAAVMRSRADHVRRLAEDCRMQQGTTINNQQPHMPGEGVTDV